MRRASFKWVEGFIVVGLGDYQLEIKGSNIIIVMEAREVAFKGVYRGYREHLVDSRGSRKVVYVDFAFPVKGLEKPAGPTYMRDSDTSLGPFGVSYTSLGPIGSYITIYPPPGSLYDYAVLSPLALAIFSVGRRSFYLVEEEGYRRLVMV